MSTPSTATSTIPAAHSQYGYARIDNPYSGNINAYPSNNSLPAPRLANSYHTFPSMNPNQAYNRPQRSPLTSKQPSVANSIANSTSTLHRGSQKRIPDWNEFYKNGVPKEVILIDDEDDSPHTAGIDPGPRSFDPKTVQTNATKKRKLDQGYEGSVHDSPTYSHYPAKFDNSSSISVNSATDRTASLQTTAPTSLESYGSAGGSASYEDVRAGQKRKRAPPMKETRAQLKKRQQEQASDAFADYVPPPKPLRKSGDVPVPVVRDVSILLPSRQTPLLMLSDHQSQKCQS